MYPLRRLLKTRWAPMHPPQMRTNALTMTELLGNDPSQTYPTTADTALMLDNTSQTPRKKSSTAKIMQPTVARVVSVHRARQDTNTPEANRF